MAPEKCQCFTDWGGEVILLFTNGTIQLRIVLHVLVHPAHLVIWTVIMERVKK